MTPRALAAQAIELLRGSVEATYRDGARNFFKSHETVQLFGVRTPQVKQIERDLFQPVRASWTVAEAIAACELLLQSAELEAKLTGLLLLGRFKKQFDASLLAQVELWLRRDYCSNWATTDALCSCVLGPLLQSQPALVAQTRRWIRAKHLYLRRAAMVSLLPAIRRGSLLDEAYEFAEALLDDREDLMHKAVGWVLRDAGKKDARRLEWFLLTHGPRVPRTTLRYAIERFPETKRQKLLAQTRTSPQ